MRYQVKTLEAFQRQFKRLLKKHTSLTADLTQLVDSLTADPTQGTALGRNCYKIRLRISSKGKGKSGGARIITCVVAVTTEVYLLAIYDKSERDSITDAELAALVNEIPIAPE